MTDSAIIGHKKWATELTQLLRAVLGDERFPVDVEKLAMEVSASRFPKDPLKAIKGDNLPGFEGALYPLGDPRDGWAIIYNNTNVSSGRTKFTIGHEFGHYLAHRHLLPNGIECDDKAVIQRAGIHKRVTRAENLLEFRILAKVGAYPSSPATMAATAKADAEAIKEANVALAKANEAETKYRGRKPSFTRDQFSTVCNMLDLSTGVGEIAATTGLSRQIIYRIRDDRASAEAALTNWAA